MYVYSSSRLIAHFMFLFTCFILFTQINQLIRIHSFFIMPLRCDSCAGGIVFLGCPSVPFSGTRYFRNTKREFLKIWQNLPLGLKDELTRFWWSKVDIPSIPSSRELAFSGTLLETVGLFPFISKKILLLNYIWHKC